MANFWQTMGNIFGAKFINQFGVVGGDAFKVWCQVLSGCTPQDIQRGAAKLMQSKSEYMPDAKQFLAMCQVSAEDEGYLSVRSALDLFFSGQLKDDLQSDAIRYAVRKVGTFELRNMSNKDKTILDLFTKHYADAIEMIRSGRTDELVPNNNLALAHTDQEGEKISPVDVESAQSALANMF